MSSDRAAWRRAGATAIECESGGAAPRLILHAPANMMSASASRLNGYCRWLYIPYQTC